jgi:L-threonylcarbamoyladenylate synthase
MSIETPSQNTIQKAASLLREGKLVAFPTETVYGLGADATDDRAVRAIFEAKGRPSNNPLIIHVHSIEQLFDCIDASRCTNKTISYLNLLKPLWPGPLSVVAPKSSHISDIVSGGGSSVAIRIPNHPVALALLEYCQRPIAAPSANPSMYVSPTTAQHVQSGLGDRVSLVLDGGPCTIGIESTVLSLLEDTPIILRPGSITREQLEVTLSCQVVTKQHFESSSQPNLSPGLLPKHYAPRTPVRFLNSIDKNELETYKRVGVILFDKQRHVPPNACMVRYASTSNDAQEIAHHLFRELRLLDTENLDIIAVDTCDISGIGLAIMDRLTRATHS